jgi:ribosomal protein S18 acetylase RimI-like enzyme
VQISALDLGDRAVAEAIIALQRRAYRIEADLIGSDGIPPLHETLEELLASGETFLGARLDGTLAGFVSWKVDGDTLDLHRLAVDPHCFRRGVGRALVRAAEAAEAAPRRVVVQTGAANEPAKTLYRGEGFVEVGEREPAPGILVTLFEKRRGPAT